MRWKPFLNTFYWFTIVGALLVAALMELFGGPVWLYWPLFFWFMGGIMVTDSDWYKAWLRRR